MELVRRHSVEPPERPVLVVALEGWLDAGLAAATAAAALLESLELKPFATFEVDELVDLRERRPRVRIDDGVRGPIVHQAPQLLVGDDRRGSGVALLIGPEPDFRWHTFASEVADLVSELGSPIVLSLGAFPAPTPHTRPIRVAGVGTDRALVHRVGFVPGAIDVPACAADLVCSAAEARGIAALALWARMPHYLSATPYPAASVALLEAVSSISGLSLDLVALRNAAASATKRVDELIAQSEEHTAMVHQLEQIPDEQVGLVAAELPSGEEIAAELERYLRGELS